MIIIILKKSIKKNQVNKIKKKTYQLNDQLSLVQVNNIISYSLVGPCIH